MLPLVLSFLTLISRCWWTLACALPLVLSFLILVTPSCRLSRVIQPTRGWGYTFFRTVAAKKLVGLCKQHCLDAVYLGLYNRQQVGVRLFPYRRRRHGTRARAPWRRRYGKSLTPTCCRLYNPRLPVKRCNPNLVSVV